LEKIPFFLLAAAASAITVIAQHSVGAVATVSQFSLEKPRSQRARFLLPISGQAPSPHKFVCTLPAPQSLAGGNCGPRHHLARRHHDFRGHALAQTTLSPGRMVWFLGMLVPTIGLVQVGSQAMADRYSYVPTVGILIALTWECVS